MAVSTAQLGNLSITTQVVPAGENNIPGLATLSSSQNWTHGLKKKQPIKSLSAVVILIGVLQLSIGVSMHVAENNYPSLLSRSGVLYLGSLLFISTGIITVVFSNEESIVKIKACLISNVINATFATFGIVLCAFQIYTDTQACWVPVEDSSKSNQCMPGNSSIYSSSDYHFRYYYPNYTEFIYKLRVSLNSLVLFYIIVGFIISNCIILLRWKSFKEAKYTLLGN